MNDNPSVTSEKKETPRNWIDYAEDRKIYVSSLNFATRDGSLKEYFEKFGEVEKAEVKMESVTRSRGFGFVVFTDPEVLARLLELPHTLDGRKIEVKRAITMKEKFSTNKLFVGGLPLKLPNEDVIHFFSSFGEIDDIEWVMDRVTGNRKGFCFIIFKDSQAVEVITEGKVPPQSQKHDINGFTVECKKKFPDNHPIQKKIKRVQQQRKERLYPYDQMGYGYDYASPGYYDEFYYSYHGAANPYGLTYNYHPHRYGSIEGTPPYPTTTFKPN